MKAKRVRKRRLRSFLLVLILAGLASAGLTPARKAYDQRRHLAAEERKLASLQKSNGQLADRVQRLSDPDYLEKTAREQLGVVKPGEIPYVVEPGPAPAEPPKPAPSPRAIHEKAWDWITSRF